MANVYARSTDGNNADSGATWALAKANIGSLALAAGDTGFVSQNHAETGAASITLALAGTLATPSRILCGNDAAEPPTALATTGVASATGANTITVSGHGYMYGLALKAGSGSASGSVQILLGWTAGEVQIFENCAFWIEGTAAGSSIQAGRDNGAAPSTLRWRNCDVKFANTGQGLLLGSADFHWRGGSILSGSSAITRLFNAENTRAAQCTLDGVDLSNAATGLVLVTNSTSRAVKYVFRNCKLPASWSGSIFTSAPNVGTRGEMRNCDSADTNYRLWVEDYAGSIKSETTIIRTGGASDGTTGLSWKMASSANAEFPTHLLESPEIEIWNDTTGASKTVTVEIVHDSAGAGSGGKFQDDEIWLQVQYYGTSGFPLGAHITDCKADVLATAANQADSTETWTTTGLAGPVKQALSVTFTPQEKGQFVVRVVVAKASKTVYVCPKATVS